MSLYYNPPVATHSLSYLNLYSQRGGLLSIFSPYVIVSVGLSYSTPSHMVAHEGGMLSKLKEDVLAGVAPPGPHASFQVQKLQDQVRILESIGRFCVPEGCSLIGTVSGRRYCNLG